MTTNAPHRLRSRSLAGVSVLAITTAVAACGPGTTGVYKNIQNPLHHQKSQRFAFDEIHVWQDGEHLSLAGRVTPSHFGFTNGHVDVAIRGASGHLHRVLSIRVRDRYYKGRWRGAFFKARLLFKGPADARIHLALHDPETKREEDSNLEMCLRNQALAPRKDVAHAR